MTRIAQQPSPLAMLVACALAPRRRTAATRWSLRGAGWGHGIGMSQYGAYGYAKHGAGYREILRHYYRGTSIADRAAARRCGSCWSRTVSVSFRSAANAGERGLDPDSIYKATRDGSTVVLRSATAVC